MSTPKSPQAIAADVRAVFPKFDADCDAGTFAYQLAHTDTSDGQVATVMVAAFKALQPPFRLYAILSAIHARNTNLVATLLANAPDRSRSLDLALHSFEL